ncbi:hypothetical protein [Actinopolymorpha sp. B9G3]|uniref:hypothetical protein n=1 Tax=Actinopolymorpha sp. B9G3 TaxID=3158970 RepID=UPI0032D930D6
MVVDARQGEGFIDTVVKAHTQPLRARHPRLATNLQRSYHGAAARSREGLAEVFTVTRARRPTAGSPER